MKLKKKPAVKAQVKAKKPRAKVVKKAIGVVTKAKAKIKSKSKAVVKSLVKSKSKPVVKAKPAMKNQTALKTSTSKYKAPQAAVPVSMRPAAKMKLVDVSEFVTPLDDRMIIQANEEEKVTAGGLIIPDTVTSVSGNRKGVVLSVGRGHRDPKGRVRPMDVKAGDKIVFSTYAGSKFDYQGSELIILRETDVMGVLD